MKLIFILVVLMSAILVFVYLCKKLGVDVGALLNRWSSQPTIQPTSQPPIWGKIYNVEYAAFASLVWNCLYFVHRICGLACPDTVSGIYCAQIADRIKCYDGGFSFLFEIPVSATNAIRNGKIGGKKIDMRTVKDVLQENLPDYMDGGYLYTGTIDVWPIEQDRIRIEIHGVNRKI